MTKTYTLPEAIKMAINGKTMTWTSVRDGLTGEAIKGEVRFKLHKHPTDLTVLTSKTGGCWQATSTFPLEGWIEEKTQYTGKDIAFVAQHPDRWWRRKEWGGSAFVSGKTCPSLYMQDLISTDWETCDE
jgi:hypothetical protein